MARTKPKNTITTRDQAEAALAQIDTIDRQFAEWDMAEASAVAETRERFAAQRKEGGYVGLEAQRAYLIKELEGWAETEAGSWKTRTLVTPFGKLGFRLTPPTVVLIKKVAKNLEEAKEWLKTNGLTQFIRSKEEVDKEAILAAERAEELDAAELNMCGLKIKQTDEFWIETAASKDLEKAAKKLKVA